MTPISLDDVEIGSKALLVLHDRLGELLDESGRDPAPDSNAAAELEATTDRDTLEASISQATLLLEAAAARLG